MRFAVTGLGVCSPIGTSEESFFAALESGRSGVAVDEEGTRLGFPLAGRSDAAGILSSTDGSIFELACTSGAQGKCARFGYAPWRQAPDGRPMISTTISADTGRMLPIHA